MRRPTPLSPSFLLANVSRRRGCGRTSRLYRSTVLSLLLLALAVRPAGAAQVTHPTEGYTVTYPDNWFANNRGPGPIMLENVPAEAYLHGGILPEGGANITIQVLPPETDEYAKLDQFAFGSQNVHRSSRLDHPPARLDHTFKLDSDIVYKSVSIAVRSGGKLTNWSVKSPHLAARPLPSLSMSSTKSR